MINSDNFFVDFVKFYLHYGILFFSKSSKVHPYWEIKNYFLKKKLLKTFTSTSFLSDLFYNEKDQ